MHISSQSHYLKVESSENSKFSSSSESTVVDLALHFECTKENDDCCSTISFDSNADFNNEQIIKKTDSVYLKNLMKTGNGKLNNLIPAIIQKQYSLQNDNPELNNINGIEIKSSDKTPQLFILSEAIFVVDDALRKGAQSTVFGVTRVGIHGTPLKKVILKRSRINYSIEEELVKRNLGLEFYKDPKIDSFQRTAKIENDCFIAVCEKSDMDLTEVEYHSQPLPVTYAIQQLIGMAGGVALFHKNNIVHRDIKGANLLVNSNGCGKVTDTGLARERPKKGEIHHTASSPTYLAPFVFENLQAQLNRQGHQGPEADVYSFGKTIQKDVIPRIFSGLSKNFNVDISSYKKIIKTEKFVVTSKNEILDIESKNSGRVMVWKSKNKCYAMPLPDPKKIYDASLETLGLFSTNLQEEEFIRFKKLIKLAFNLQQEDPNALPEMEWVEQKLIKIITTKEESPSIFNRKRTRENDIGTEDPSLIKKQKLEHDKSLSNSQK